MPRRSATPYTVPISVACVTLTARVDPAALAGPDPVAALGMTVFIGREGLEAWRGEDCGCNGDLATRAEESASGEGCGCRASCGTKKTA